MALKGILFDMDGVLIDTEEQTAEAAVLMFKELGATVNKTDFLPFLGTGSIGYFNGVANMYGIDIDLAKAEKRTFELFNELAKENLNLLPGVTSFIRLCREKGLKLAIGTSAPRVKLTINFENTELDYHQFDAIVVGEDITNNKPAPDIYLKAASLIGLKPEECLVIEDAPNGIIAAKAAGCKCLALTTSQPEIELQLADWVIKNLAQVPDDVLNW